MSARPLSDDEMVRRVEHALRGLSLYGDDFTLPEIEAWFRDEADGYFELRAHEEAPPKVQSDQYEYEQLVAEHAFRRLPDRHYSAVLGIGCAQGRELYPILNKSDAITILEPSDGFKLTELHGKPVTYLKPAASGIMPFENDSFDLIVCFGVLHHIPNVSTVLGEMFRVLKPGGRAVLREPTISLGDWRSPRQGYTKRERGIPFTIFRNMIVAAQFTIEYESRCMFSLTHKLAHALRRPIYTSKWAVRADRLICSLPIWPQSYHATTIWHRFRPTSAAFVLAKSE